VFKKGRRDANNSLVGSLNAMMGSLSKENGSFVRYNSKVSRERHLMNQKVIKGKSSECLIAVMTSMTLIGGWTLVPALA
jgi:hypothetical protein